MDKVVFDQTWTIKELSTLKDEQFIEEVLKLINKRKKIIDHFNNNQSLGIDILDLDKNTEYNISSICWQKSLEFFPNGNLTQKQTNTVFAGENLMIVKFICEATNKNSLFPKLSVEIINKYSDNQYKEYFSTLIS